MKTGTLRYTQAWRGKGSLFRGHVVKNVRMWWNERRGKTGHRRHGVSAQGVSSWAGQATKGPVVSQTQDYCEWGLKQLSGLWDIRVLIDRERTWSMDGKCVHGFKVWNITSSGDTDLGLLWVGDWSSSVGCGTLGFNRQTEKEHGVWMGSVFMGLKFEITSSGDTDLGLKSFPSGPLVTPFVWYDSETC